MSTDEISDTEMETKGGVRESFRTELEQLINSHSSVVLISPAVRQNYWQIRI